MSTSTPPRPLPRIHSFAIATARPTPSAFWDASSIGSPRTPAKPSAVRATSHPRKPIASAAVAGRVCTFAIALVYACQRALTACTSRWTAAPLPSQWWKIAASAKLERMQPTSSPGGPYCVGQSLGTWYEHTCYSILHHFQPQMQIGDAGRHWHPPLTPFEAV